MSEPTSKDATVDRYRALHDDAVVIDGLIFMSDGNPDVLRAGKVTAANITVSGLTADFTQALDQLAGWRKRVTAPGTAWLLVETVDDILRAKAEGQVGLIMGWQSIQPFGSRLERVAAFHAMGLRGAGYATFLARSSMTFLILLYFLAGSVQNLSHIGSTYTYAPKNWSALLNVELQPQ